MYGKEIRKVKSMIMSLGIGIKREFWSVITVHAPGMERSKEKRESYWKELKGCTERYEDRGRVLVIGDMNARVGDGDVKGVLGKFGV